MSARASSTDAITVTTVVAVDAASAFSIFTDEVDLWWRREPRYRAGGPMRFEPGVGGRLLEGAADAEIELGRVTTWEPGRRLVLAWTGASQVAGARTEVEIRFEPEADASTRVTIEHRGWDAVPARHPARIGLTAARSPA